MVPVEFHAVVVFSDQLPTLDLHVHIAAHLFVGRSVSGSRFTRDPATDDLDGDLPTFGVPSQTDLDWVTQPVICASKHKERNVPTKKHVRLLIFGPAQKCLYRALHQVCSSHGTRSASHSARPQVG